MKTLKKLMALTLFVVMIFQVQMLATVPVSASENLINNISSNNWGMYAVPVLGEMKIDGYFDEWDWSSRICMFPDFEARNTNSAEVCVNYDDDNLYLGFIVKDITPLNNTVDPELEYSITWRGDCFQLRFRGDHNVWATFAYHNLTDRYSMYLNDLDAEAQNKTYNIMYLTEPGSTKFTVVKEFGGTLGTRPAQVTGMEMCAVLDKQVDNNTVNYEVKFPRSAIFYETGTTYKAGDIIQMGIECYWSNDSGRMPGTNYKDNLQAGTSSRSFFWTAYNAWGDVVFLDQNHIEQRNYVKDYESPISGYFNIDLEVDKNAKYLTVTVDDEEGCRVRNLIAELEIDEGSEYIVEEKINTKIVRVKWDGRDNEGEKVSPGTYYFNGITHEGISPIYDYHFYSPGKVPWNNAATSAGWLADHFPPEAAFAYEDEVFFGAHFAEGGTALIAYDPVNREKKWGVSYGGKFITANSKYIWAQPGWTFTFSSPIYGNIFIGRYNRADGSYAPYTVFGETKEVEYANTDLLGILNGQTVATVTGMAANEEVLAIATGDNSTTGTVKGATLYPMATAKYKNYISGISLLRHDDMHVYKRIAVEDIGQIAFSKDYKHLYAVSGNKIVEVNIASGEVTDVNLKLGDAVLGPMTVDNDGNIVIFDKGDDCQVKAYSAKTGDLVYTIGKKGGRSYDGEWDETGFIKQVSSITCGYEDRIWVVECFENPRRISEWSRDGELLYDMIGNAQYSCMGASIHQQDPTLAYYMASEMKIDIENNTYKMNKVLYIPDAEKHEMFPIDAGYGIEYFSSDASGEMHNYVWCNQTLYIEGEDGRYRPCFKVGTLSDFFDFTKSDTSNSIDINTEALYQNYDRQKAREYEAYWGRVFSGYSGSDTYIWNDLNMDGIVSRDECDIYPSYSDYYSTYDSPLYTSTGALLKNGSTQLYASDAQGKTRSEFFYDAYVYDENNNLVSIFKTQEDEIARPDDVADIDATVGLWENYWQKTGVASTSYQYYYTGPPVIPYQAYWDQRVTTDTLEWSGYMTRPTNAIGIWSPVEFSENGAPIYKLEGCKLLENISAASSILFEDSDIVFATPTQTRNTYMDDAVKGYDKNTGKLIWSYRNDWPGVHASHMSGMQAPYGVLNGTLKNLGTFYNSEGDQYTVIRGNYGCNYIITTDGYYVATLMQDSRTVATALPADLTPGDDMNGFSGGGEPFGGNGSTQSDGGSRFVIATGGRVPIVVRIEGMDTIKHIKTVPFKATLKELEKCYAWVEPKEEGTGIVTGEETGYEIKYAAKGFKLDGASDDWEGYKALHISVDGTAEYADARLAWNEENLYAIFEVSDESPMVNGANEYVRLFKGGDVCDINLSETSNASSTPADGDIRIMLSKFKGEPIAVLFKQKDSKKTGTEEAQFSSPVRTVDYDTVKILSDAEVVINYTDTGYTIEAKISWNAIGYATPSTNSVMRGDLGIITGDSEGTLNLARIYYFNKDTGLTNDIPGEASTYPGKWGGITFSSDDPSEAYWAMFGE